MMKKGEIKKFIKLDSLDPFQILMRQQYYYI
jgi:hypothetical protein